MVAIGLSGVFKYGGKFLGYLVAVVLAAGVFVGGGAYLAASGGVSVADPSLSSVGSYRAITGVVLLAVGAAITLSGLFGMGYKLVADATAAGVVSANAASAASAVTAATTEDESAEAEETAEGVVDDAETVDAADTADDMETADVERDDAVTDDDGVSRSEPVETNDVPDEQAVAEESGKSPLDGDEAPAAVADHSEDGRAGDTDHGPVTAATTEPDPSRAQAETTQATESSPDGEEMPPTSTESAATTDSTSTDRAPVDETTEVEPERPESASSSTTPEAVDDSIAGRMADEDEDWTESAYATGTQPDDDSIAEDSTAEETIANGNANENDDATGTKEDEREVWTPPDPSEFEQSAEDEADGPLEGDAAVDDTTPSEPEFDWGEEPAATSEQEGRTWDDVRSASSGDGIEADPDSDGLEESSVLPGDERATTDDKRTTTDVTGGDDVYGEPVERTDANLSDGRTDVETANADPATEADDEEKTLADEGVTSFEVDGDDDPLGDRLSGDGS